MYYKYPELKTTTLSSNILVKTILFCGIIILSFGCSKNTPESNNESGKDLQYIFLVKSKAIGENFVTNGITCYNPNLSKRWDISNLPAFNRYASYIYKNTLFINTHSTGEKMLYAVDINTGTIKWKNPTTGIYSGFTVKNDTLFAGYAEGNNYKLRAFNISNGSLIFDHAAPEIGMPPLGLAVIDNFIYANYNDISTRDAGIAAYDYVNKRVTWRTHAGLSFIENGFISEILPYKDLLIFRTGTRFITAINRHTGEIKWSRLAYDASNLQLVNDELRVMHKFATFGVFRYFKLDPLKGEEIFQIGEYFNSYTPSALVGTNFGFYASGYNIYKFNLNTGEINLDVVAARTAERLIAGIKGTDNTVVTLKQIFSNQSTNEYRLITLDTKKGQFKDSVNINGFKYFDFFAVNQ